MRAALYGPGDAVHGRLDTTGSALPGTNLDVVSPTLFTPDYPYPATAGGDDTDPRRYLIPQAQAIITVGATAWSPTSDAIGDLVTFTANSGVMITIPSDANLSGWLTGHAFEMLQLGTGQLTIVAGSGVNALVVSGLTAKSRAQGSRIGAQRIAPNTWNVLGDLAAA